MINDFLPDTSLQISLLKNYTIHHEIGEGSNGCIYKATQLTTGQTVAIKTLKYKDQIDEQGKKQQMDRFEHEARLCAGINHPNIVKIIDRGLADKHQPYAVFEYVEGQSLREYILQNKSLKAKEAGLLMGQVLEALVSAHKMGIVHRDLKPHNIMVSDLGTKKHIKILDFGISAFAHKPAYAHAALSELPPDFQGTPAYCAPEQLRGEPPTIKSDLYAWGLIFIECLTGKTVMAGKSIAEILEMQLSPSEVFIPAVLTSHPLGGVLKKVLHKNQELRPDDTLKLYEEFSAIDLASISGSVNLEPNIVARELEYTLANELVLGAPSSSRKQLTVLCLKLSISFSKDSLIDMEIVDTLLHDQLNVCREMAARFGGFIAGSMFNNLIVYFGYPNSKDADARMAGRTALELINEGNKRSALLYEQYRVSLSMSISLHTGTMLIQNNRVPEGNVPNTALNLLNCTPAGTVLVSGSSKKLLDPYLEFERAEKISMPNEMDEIQTYRLIGERQSEALSFQKTWKKSSRFVGRETEKDEIHRLWAGVLNGWGSAVLISGQAGIGKSRLVYEIQKQANAHKTIECRCLPEHQNNALYPFFAWFRNQWGIAGCENNDTIIHRLKAVLTEAQCNLNESLPILCLWMSISMPEGYSIDEIQPAEQKKVLFNVLKACLHGIETDHTLFFVLEDLHWIDSFSFELIEFLLQDIDQRKCLFLMTSRPEFKSPWASEHLKTIEIQPFDISLTEAMIINVLGGKPISEPVLNYISERSDGVPFFVEELTDMLLEQRYLVLESGTFQLIGNIHKIAVPITLHDLLNTRLEKLGFAKESVQLASAIGREFNYDLLIKASIKDEASVQSDLVQMQRADIVYKQRRVNDECYVFRHALIQDAAYESLANLTRVNVHLRIAEVVEAEILKNENTAKLDLLVRLANHLFNGKRVLDGVSRLIEATEITRRQSANVETKALCYSALNWLSQIPSTDETKREELKIRQILISAITAIEGHGSALIGDELEKIQLLSKELGDNDQLFPTRCMQIYFFCMRQDWISATACAREFYKDTKNCPEVKWIIASSVMLGQQCFFDGCFEEAAVLLENSLKLYNHDLHKSFTYEFGIDQGVLAASLLCTTYYFLDRENEIPAIEQQSIAWANDINHVHTSSTLYYGLCCLYIYKYDKKTASRYCSVINAIGSKEQPNMYLPYCVILNAWANSSPNELKKAIYQIEGTGVLIMKSFWYSILAKEEIKNGRYNEARKLIEESLSLIGSPDTLFFASEINRLLGLCYWGINETKSCEKYLNKAFAIASSQKAFRIMRKIGYTLEYISCNNTFSNSLI